ncbi:EamA family transporter [Limibacillus sp. MBR-115]|jgi:drug/metabolite transporter (DMT)-like permease|uniref:EamA family transporter n=1 Tax=Limibacillus sp. MBR-115 TaxID=3156465 RepID=UPI003395A2DA
MSESSIDLTTIYLLVLLAAVMHATWNAIVKSGGDKLVVQALVIFSHAPFVALALPFLPVPPWESFGFIAASTAIHSIYYWALINAYKLGDLSQVYPIARGSAPLLVAVGGFLLVGESLSPLEMVGLFILSIGLISLAWRFGDPLAGDRRPVYLALLTGLTIGGYSLVDGMGGRSAETAISYIAWLFALEHFPLTLYALHRRKWQLSAFRPYWKRGLFGGIISGLAYGIVIWAMSVAPMAHVVALRETSVVIAAGIGALLLGEGFGPRRMAAALLVAVGAVLLRVAGSL